MTAEPLESFRDFALSYASDLITRFKYDNADPALVFDFMAVLCELGASGLREATTEDEREDAVMRQLDSLAGYLTAHGLLREPS